MMFKRVQINLPKTINGSMNKIMVRTFAENPNDIAKRIASTKSIQKITKSMKMVSAAKLRGDTNRLLDGRGFGTGLQQVVNPQPIEEETALEFKNPLYLLLTSDRGLCGGVNGYTSKKVKANLDLDASNGLNSKVIVIGDKGAPLMQRTHGESIIASFSEPWKTPMNFSKVLSMSERIVILAKQNKSDVIKICYNRFLNSIKYETEFKEVPFFSSFLKDKSGEELSLPVPLNRYEIEYESMDEAVNNIEEYALAVKLYGCCLDNATSEQSSRMTAMDNASKNASEMVDFLTVKFNRARQAKITTELTEIISGAESLNK